VPTPKRRAIGGATAIAASSNTISVRVTWGIWPRELYLGEAQFHNSNAAASRRDEFFC
jgi:hypothetical protein